MVVMKQILTVKQKNLDTQEEVLLCEEAVDVMIQDGEVQFTYHEKEPFCGTISCRFTSNGCTIDRQAEGIHSKLRFDVHRKTKGTISSIYGDIDMELVTQRYIRQENIIFLEYYTSQQSSKLDSFRFVFRLRNLV